MPAFSASFPSRVLWKEMKGIPEKKVRKTTIGKSHVEYIFRGISQGETNSRGIGDTLHCTPQKTRGGSCQNHPTGPETGKHVKNLERPNACPFPLIRIKGSLEGNETNIGEQGWENH